METYFTMQEDTKLKIQKARVNFKKSPKERITQSYLETRLETLENYWTLYRDTHRVIISEFDSKELLKSTYYTADAYGVTEELYTDYKTELKDGLLMFKIDSKTVALSSSNVNEPNVGQSFSVRLPKISIPIFSGKYTEWTSFRDLFISLIHSNKALDDVQRLHYLKGYLTGEAEQLLRHISITANNYKVCWDQLEHRYNNKLHLANCILKRFMNQKNIQSETSSAIKELLDTTNECLNALKNLNIDISSWDIIVIYIVTLKLDTESRKLWEVQICKSNGELPKVSELNNFLEQRFRSLEFLDSKVINKSINSTRTTKVMHVTSNLSCEFCTESHKLINCKKFAKEDVEVRRNFVQTNKLCFNCLGPNHSVFSCRNSTNCRVCRKRHHSLLHPKSFPKSDHSSSDQEEDGTDQSPPSTSQSETPNNIVSCFSNVNSQVLLATALVKVEGRTSTFVLRSLLDQGSQASFITESSVQLLGLKKIPNKSFISGLGSDQSATLRSKWFVTVQVQSRHDPNFTVVVKAHVLDNITSLLPERKIVFKALSTQMSDLKLADPSFNIPNKIDILLGAEVYCQVLLEGVIKGLPGFSVAQNTKLGWILSGYIHSPTNQGSLQQNKIVNMHTLISTESDDLLMKCKEKVESSSGNQTLLSEEEHSCKSLFTETVRRDLTCVMTRYETVEEGIQIDHQNDKLFSCGSFKLQKWSCNDNVLLREIDKNNKGLQYTVQLPMFKTPASVVSEIARLFNSSIAKTIDQFNNQWSHVKFNENLVDCVPQAIHPSNISEIEIWKIGLKWLQENTVHYSKRRFKKKKIKILCHLSTEGIDIISRFSSLKGLIRVISYCRRFLNMTKRANTKSQTTRWLTSKEINDSLLTCIRLCQKDGFLKEIESLQGLGNVNRSSRLTSLNPFLDGDGILRVGGRLQKANVVEEMKHPILIPYKSHLASLIVAHERTIHGGPQLLLSYVRTQYWIVNAKSLIRQHVCKCVCVCVRYSAQTNQQLMGQMPSARVIACRPFQKSGVDYAEPIAARTTKGRGYHSTKGCICLFICMANRAIHLEVLSDLTSEAFLATFKRFVARREHCTELWSDNGTNFVGANRKLKNLSPREGSVVASG